MTAMLLDGFFSQLGVGNYIMLGVMVVGVVVLYIWGSHYKGKDSRAEMLQRRYGLMDADGGCGGQHHGQGGQAPS
mgnify:CR=1 FL=1